MTNYSSSTENSIALVSQMQGLDSTATTTPRTSKPRFSDGGAKKATKKSGKPRAGTRSSPKTSPTGSPTSPTSPCSSGRVTPVSTSPTSPASSNASTPKAAKGTMQAMAPTFMPLWAMSMSFAGYEEISDDEGNNSDCCARSEKSVKTASDVEAPCPSSSSSAESGSGSASETETEHRWGIPSSSSSDTDGADEDTDMDTRRRHGDGQKPGSNSNNQSDDDDDADSDSEETSTTICVSSDILGKVRKVLDYFEDEAAAGAVAVDWVNMGFTEGALAERVALEALLNQGYEDGKKASKVSRVIEILIENCLVNEARLQARIRAKGQEELDDLILDNPLAAQFHKKICVILGMEKAEEEPASTTPVEVVPTLPVVTPETEAAPEKEEAVVPPAPTPVAAAPAPQKPMSVQEKLAALMRAKQQPAATPSSSEVAAPAAPAAAPQKPMTFQEKMAALMRAKKGNEQKKEEGGVATQKPSLAAIESRTYDMKALLWCREGLPKKGMWVPAPEVVYGVQDIPEEQKAKDACPFSLEPSAKSWRSSTAPQEEVGNLAASLMPTENSWAAQQQRKKQQKSGAEDEDAVVEKAIRGLLNKLTVEKFEGIYKKLITESGIQTANHVKSLMREVFDKAINQPHFAKMYVELCLRLSRDLAGVKSDATATTTLEEGEEQQKKENVDFRRVLVEACQHAFERDLSAEAHANLFKFRMKEGDTAFDEDLFEAQTKHKARMLGNIRFMGNLLTVGLLAPKTFVAIATSLLDQTKEQWGEEAAECLALLLTTAGAVFDHPKSPIQNENDQLFGKVKEMLQDASLSTRIRCLLQDVIDLRAAKWVDTKLATNRKEGPTRLAEVRKAWASGKDSTTTSTSSSWSSSWSGSSVSWQSGASKQTSPTSSTSSSPRETSSPKLKAARDLLQMMSKGKEGSGAPQKKSEKVKEEKKAKSGPVWKKTKARRSSSEASY